MIHHEPKILTINQERYQFENNNTHSLSCFSHEYAIMPTIHVTLSFGMEKNWYQRGKGLKLDSPSPLPLYRSQVLSFLWFFIFFHLFIMHNLNSSTSREDWFTSLLEKSLLEKSLLRKIVTEIIVDIIIEKKFYFRKLFFNSFLQPAILRNYYWGQKSLSRRVCFR